MHAPFSVPRVGVSQLHVRLLQKAAEKLGGMDEVARYLGISDVRLRIWMRGLIAPPDEIFLKLVDLISEGPASSPPRCGTGSPGCARDGEA